MKVAVIGLVLLFGASAADAQVRVDGYRNKQGTYVAPHLRTAPDHTTRNNYGAPGNYNPNTGRITPHPSNPYGSLGGGYGGTKRNSLGGWDND